MPGQSGTAQALGSVSGIIGKLIPLGIGLAAEAYGLQTAMWLQMAGPIALLIGLPRILAFQARGRGEVENELFPLFPYPFLHTPLCLL